MEALRLAASVLALALLAGLGGCAVYNTVAEGAVADLMLQGHDPVSYFENPSPALSPGTRI